MGFFWLAERIMHSGWLRRPPELPSERPVGCARRDQLRVVVWLQRLQEAHRLHPRVRLHQLDEQRQYSTPVYWMNYTWWTCYHVVCHTRWYPVLLKSIRLESAFTIMIHPASRFLFFFFFLGNGLKGRDNWRLKNAHGCPYTLFHWNKMLYTLIDLRLIFGPLTALRTLNNIKDVYIYIIWTFIFKFSQMFF